MKVKPKLEKSKKQNVLGPKIPKSMKASGSSKVSKNKTSGFSRVLTKKIAKKVTENQEKETKNKTLPGLDISIKTIEDALNIVTDLYKEHKEKSKSNLFSDNDFLYLQFQWMRIPEVPEQRRKYVKLHHGLFGENPEICLFTANRIPKDKKSVKRTPDEKIEYTVDFYEEVLKNQNIQGITGIIPLFQLKTEYNGYTTNRKLVDKFDLFLCQSTLLDNPAFLRHLGKAFTKKNKVPLSLKFPKKMNIPDENFRQHYSDLVRSSWYTLKSNGDTVALRVGNVGHTKEQLMENLVSVLNQLTGPNASPEAIPGGNRNIRSIMLKTSRSRAVPLYISLESPNNVPIPKLKSNKPLFNAVEDELSTIPGKRVTVLPTGEVFVTDDPNEKRISGWEYENEKTLDEMESDIPESETEELEETPVAKKKQKVLKKEKKQVPVKEKKSKKNQQKPEKDGNLSEDSDDEAETAEQQYLSKWNEEADEDDESDGDQEDDAVKKGKKNKKTKKGKNKSPVANKKLKEKQAKTKEKKIEQKAVQPAAKKNKPIKRKIENEGKAAKKQKKSKK